MRRKLLVTGPGGMLWNDTNYREWGTVGMLLVVVIVATMIMDTISGALRLRIREGAKIRGLGRTR
ncbi:MAG: hypothetical protein QM607_08835 [Microbacterium sp.]